MVGWEPGYIGNAWSYGNWLVLRCAGNLCLQEPAESCLEPWEPPGASRASLVLECAGAGVHPRAEHSLHSSSLTGRVSLFSLADLVLKGG